MCKPKDKYGSLRKTSCISENIYTLAVKVDAMFPKITDQCSETLDAHLLHFILFVHIYCG